MDIVHFPIVAPDHLSAADGPLTPPSSSRVACLHDRIMMGGVVADVCPQTGTARWLDGADHDLDPAVALARLFGSFDLVAALDGIGAPGPTVLAYRPDSRRGRAAMRALPLRRWIEAAPKLWVTHDGERLLMAPTDPVLADNLVRDL